MKILITEFTGLGNLILSASIFERALNFKSLKFGIIGNNKFEGLDFSRNYDIDIINFSNSHNNLNKIKKFDYFVILPASNPPKLLFLLIFFFTNLKIIQPNYFGKKGNYITIIFFKIIRFLDNIFKKINYVEIDLDNHEISANFKMISHIVPEFNQNEIQKYYPQIKNINFGKVSISNHKLKENKYLVVQPMCSSNGLSAKNYDFSHMKKLLSSIDDNIVLIGDRNEKLTFEKIINLNKPNIFNLMGKTDFKDLCEIIFFSKGVISLESGIMHLCSYLKKKNIVIHGLSDLNKVKTFTKTTKYISKFVDCSPCVNSWPHENTKKFKDDLEAYKMCDRNLNCMKSINPMEINIAVKNFLN